MCVVKWQQFKPYNGLRHLPSITEDWSVSLKDDERRLKKTPVTERDLELLYSPLPRDLPTVNKGLLTAMAAHHGDIDRYTRLVNRKLLPYESEVDAIVRGIHWNPLFARFWVTQLEQNTDLVTRFTRSHSFMVKQAIAARRIMCNDWQDFENGWDPSIPKPFHIWWPHRPHELTLLDLHRKAPDMKDTCVIAAILCDYPWVFDQIKIDPPAQGMFFAATQAKNTYFLLEILPRLEELGLDWDVTDECQNPDYTWILQEPERPSSNYLFPTFDLPDSMPYLDPDDWNMRHEPEVDIVHTRILWRKEKLDTALARQADV